MPCGKGDMGRHYSMRDFFRQMANLLLARYFERRGVLAEREGFEPPIAFRLCLISSQVHSTGLCHLSAL